jgi:hypothetical protein
LGIIVAVAVAVDVGVVVGVLVGVGVSSETKLTEKSNVPESAEL